MGVTFEPWSSWSLLFRIYPYHYCYVFFLLVVVATAVVFVVVVVDNYDGDVVDGGDDDDDDGDDVAVLQLGYTDSSFLIEKLGTET